MRRFLQKLQRNKLKGLLKANIRGVGAAEVYYGQDTLQYKLVRKGSNNLFKLKDNSKINIYLSIVILVLAIVITTILLFKRKRKLDFNKEDKTVKLINNKSKGNFKGLRTFFNIFNFFKQKCRHICTL